MCGIVGVLSNSVVDRRTVERMRGKLAHRDPDHAGPWQSAEGRVCLGHRRLSIIELDVRSKQPMCSRDGRFVVTFSGEIYNYRTVRREPEGEGVRFGTESDTEVLLEAYRRWGADSLLRLSGVFAFAVWDGQGRRLFCARDRAGEKIVLLRIRQQVLCLRFRDQRAARLAGTQAGHRLRSDDRLPYVRLRLRSEEHLAQHAKTGPGPRDDG